MELEEAHQVVLERLVFDRRNVVSRLLPSLLTLPSLSGSVAVRTRTITSPA